MKKQEGFTAVELLVALIVGVLLVGSAYQVYTTLVRESSDSLRRAQASGVAYQLIREQQKTMVGACAATEKSVAVPADAGLGPTATAKLVITCPYDTHNPDGTIQSPSAMSLVAATVTYQTTARQEVTRAITVRP